MIETGPQIFYPQGLAKDLGGLGGREYIERREIGKRDEGNASFQAGERRGARRTSGWKGTGVPGETAGGPVVGWGAVGLLSFCT